MAKKDFLNETKEVVATEVQQIPEIQTLILEDTEMEVVFSTKAEAMLVGLEYQRQNSNVSSVKIEEFLSLTYGNYFKIVPVAADGRQIAVLPTDLLVNIKQEKYLKEFLHTKKEINLIKNNSNNPTIIAKYKSKILKIIPEKMVF